MFLFYWLYYPLIGNGASVDVLECTELKGPSTGIE